MRPLLFITTILIVGTATVAFAVHRGPQRTPMAIGVPAYGYPTHGEMWSELGELTPGAIVVLNPASGPGDAVDPVYEKALRPLRLAGVKVYGYVDTAYGERPVADVVAEARRFVELYSPRGIFLDQTAVDADAFGYLRDISDELRADGLEVAINPGQPVIDRRILDVADHIVNFEGNLATYRSTRFPEWRGDDDSGDQWHLVYGVDTAAEMQDVVDRAADLGVGTVFVTDRLMPNPWDGLPPYWNEELTLVDRD